MSSKRDEELMQIHDGELPQKELGPEDRVRLDALREVGDVVRARMTMAVDEAPGLDGLWAKIERELEPARPAPAAEDSGGGFFGWLYSWRGTFAVGAVAAAAGALLALTLREPKTVVKETIVIREVPTPPTEVATRPDVIDAEVESLEVVGGTGTVFHIPSGNEDEAPTTVIWVTRDEPGPEGPI